MPESNDGADEKVERSVTIQAELEAEAIEQFGGTRPTDALKSAMRRGVECQKRDHYGTIHKLVSMLYSIWEGD